MEPNAEIAGVVDHCINVIIRFRTTCLSKRGDATDEECEQMKRELRDLARQVARMNLRSEARASMILRPVEEGLRARYGPRVTRKLFGEFVACFWLPSGTIMSRDDRRPGHGNDPPSCLIPILACVD